MALQLACKVLAFPVGPKMILKVNGWGSMAPSPFIDFSSELVSRVLGWFSVPV